MNTIPLSSLFSLLTILLSCSAQTPSVRDDFDCKMRSFALEFAEEIQPFRSSTTFAEIADALNGTPEKAKGCVIQYNSSSTSTSSTISSRFPLINEPAIIPSIGGMTFYISTTGSDTNPGTIDLPFQTLSAAITASRASPGYDTILLRQGTYFPGTTLLGPADKGLTIANYPGEEAWLSGATKLNSITWNYIPQPTPNKTWVVLQDSSAIYGGSGFPVSIIDNTPSWQACQALCEANYTAGGPCTVWTWHSQNVEPEYQLQCWLRLDGAVDITSDANHTAGYLRNAKVTVPNLWVADLTSSNLQTIPGLRLNSKRLVRARYPNADPETDGFMPPAVFRANWTPQQLPRVPDTEINLSRDVINRNTTASMFQTFTAGIGGTCDRFQPNAGYWCSTSVQGGGSIIYYVPIAMQANQNILPNTPYANPLGAIIQTWRPGHWASWMYRVDGWTFVNGTTNFTTLYGGFQGSRGEDSGEDTYIENVFEELDAPSEWFFNETTKMLYLYYNATNGVPPPSDGSILATQVKWLFNITGTMENPVTDITIRGLGLRDTAYTYMDPHSIPSGGDWTLERSAVVFIEGAERISVVGNVFERIDGNAVLLSGYVRNTTISYNEFAWIGSTAVASWGNTAPGPGADSVLPPHFGSDGTNGEQPRYNTISYNLCRELGIWEKQSSFYTQFKSGYNSVYRNIVFNGPRAHLNHNDGMIGGTVHEGNLIFNSCRESGDHGPFNSWDRDPYLITDPITGQVTTTKAYDVLSKNFIIANYNSLGSVDNDDGSSWYISRNNFFVYGGGGLKNDFEGTDNHWIGNVIAFVDGALLHNGYGGQIGQPGKGYLDGHEAMFINNTAIVNYDGSYAKPICTGTPGTTIMSGSKVFSPKGQLTTDCGATFDTGAVYSSFTSTMADDMIGYAREALFN